ncbi:MAG: phosphatidate cytidylyltransferase [Treponema sp.]|jgi:phosphatidate cytidylyltransferase|nr:phosphatidate cytidylyltransferase [Treponema sp.]
MKVKKIIARLTIFFIGLPAVAALVLFLPWRQNLVLNIVAVIASGIGALEFSSMLRKKNIRVTKIESFILGCLTPAAITLTISFPHLFPAWIITCFLMLGAGWSLMSGIFTCKSELENVLNRVIGRFALLIYPGFFVYWVIKMNIWGNSYIILLFLLITFACDSIAWFFGTLFGENNRGLIAVSPNKSIAGFIGGLLGSVIIAACAAFFFPGFFFTGHSIYSLPLLFPAILLGFLTGIAAMLGDLAESAIKRSCDFKDSGKLIFGRGGVLDSIDSIAAAAPVFYMLYYFLFANII